MNQSPPTGENTVEKGKKRCACETLMPPKHPSFEKHDPDI